MEYPYCRVYEYNPYKDSNDEISFDDFIEAVEEEILGVIQYYHNFCLFYLDDDNLNYKFMDKLEDYERKCLNLNIHSYCSLFDNITRDIKHFKDKEDLELYIQNYKYEF